MEEYMEFEPEILEFSKVNPFADWIDIVFKEKCGDRYIKLTSSFFELIGLFNHVPLAKGLDELKINDELPAPCEGVGRLIRDFDIPIREVLFERTDEQKYPIRCLIVNEDGDSSEVLFTEGIIAAIMSNVPIYFDEGMMEKALTQEKHEEAEEILRQKYEELMAKLGDHLKASIGKDKQEIFGENAFFINPKDKGYIN